MAKCDICEGEKYEETQSCEACNKVVSKYKGDTRYSMPEVRKALTKAYSHKDSSKKESHFKCEYTGIISKFNNKTETLRTFNDALILTLDHKNSGSKELVVSLNIINKMKADVPHDKFKDFVIALGSHFKNENNETIEELEKTLRPIFG